MRSFSLLVLLVWAAGPVAQTLPPQGTDATFEVATWNIENFGTGSGAAAQREAVAEVIRQSDVDLWALQEIVDASDFDLLLQEIVDDGYRGVLGPNPSTGNQRLAYIYHEDVVTVIFTRPILQGNEFAFAGRLPFEMQASVTVGDQTQSLRVITFHAKCCGDQSSYNRRVDGANALKAFTDDYIDDGRAVLLLGDFNDRLNVSITGGQLSPYRPYRSDDDYTIATFDLDRLNVPTFCGNASCSSGSTLDHILFSQDLAASYVEEEDPRYEELLDEIGGYVATVSDHLPVIAQFTLLPTSGEEAPEPVAGLAVGPNPAREEAAVRFGLAEPSEVRLTVLDALGRLVLERAASLGAGDHALPLDPSSWAPGLYLVRLATDEGAAVRTLIRTR